MIAKYRDKICKLCGKTFTPKNGAAEYCKSPVERTCIVCGNTFTSICYSKASIVCDNPNCKKQAGAVAASKSVHRICRVCGKPFNANSSRQLDCGKEITKICEICGNPYKSRCGFRWQGHTCDNPECKAKYAHKGQQAHYLAMTKTCAWCGKEFHPTNNKQFLCGEPHIKTCMICGKEFTVDPGYSKETAPKCCSEECIHKALQIPHPLSKETIDKMIATKIERYGEDYAKAIWDKGRKTYAERTGYSHPIYDPAVRSKQAKTRKLSSLELRIGTILDTYKIEYISHYMVRDGDLSHEYDFYIPKYKILIDADGLYYHSYLSDPNGKQVLDSYDDIRLKLIPADHIFHLIVEGYEEKCIKQLVDIIKDIDNEVFDYNSQIFEWCRKIGFPYPEYSEARMEKDYISLCKYYALSSYNPRSRLAESIIRNFHKSIYSAHCGNCLSPLEGWNDDNILKKVILNRLIYVNDVEPSKVLRGLYISKLAPRVSIFNPVLAKYIICKYLNDFNSIFDPFSGFSGRLLGAASLGKSYIGHDLNIEAVKEANLIINMLNLTNCEVSNEDILSSSGEYDCLFTCPPYYKKEIYSNETEFKTCDEWITECLSRFKCKRYVFVVDSTDRYSQYVVENISTTSHLNTINECIVVIDK